MHFTTRFLAASLTVTLLVIVWAPSASAFPGFDDGGGDGLPPCAACHADLANFGPDHAAHAALSNNDCNSCHANSGGPGNNNPPLANCVRCHGRDADGNPSADFSAGIGRGLRQHHVTVGAAACGNCHQDTDHDATGSAPEDVLPSFYPQALNGAGLDSCDGSEERFPSNSVSLDNDGDGLTDGADPDCAVNQPPVADPNGPYSDSVGSPVSFDGSGSSDPDGSIVSYDWDFGDGGSDTGVGPTHVYASAGTFTVTLTVTDDAGATDSATTTATITAQPLPPIADANGPYSGSVGSPVSFDGSGSSDPDGTIVAYDWNFGDGGTGAGVAPTHTYTVDGSYDVMLTVTDDDGLTDTDMSSATISPAGANIPPTANANGPYNGTEGMPVQFSSAGSMDPDGAIVAYLWDFGDGNSSMDADPAHTYVAAGEYAVTLTVEDDVGDTGSDSTVAMIKGAQVNVPPVADADGPYTGVVGDPITFDGTGSFDPDGTIVSYDWDFGDGSAAPNAGPMPTHAYAAVGTYTVTLTVTDDSGPMSVTIGAGYAPTRLQHGATDTDTTTATIEDQPPPPSDGEMQYNNYCAGCHGDPWIGPAVDPTLAGGRRVTGARDCSIEGAIFGTYVFPGGVPAMQFLQALVDDGTLDLQAIADSLNDLSVTGEQRYITACAGCHGNDADGGPVDEDVRGEDYREIREAIYDEDEMRYLACLPKTDVVDIGDYLGGLPEHDDDHEDDEDRDDDKDGDDDDGDSDSDSDSDSGSHVWWSSGSNGAAEEAAADERSGTGAIGGLTLLCLLGAALLLRRRRAAGC